MKSGQLNRFIQVQSQESVRANDGSGDRTIEWVNKFAAWANIEALSGRDFIAAKGQQTELSHRITVRHSDIPDGVDWSECRISCDDETYQISAALPDNDGGRKWVTLMCKSGSAIWVNQTT